MAVGQPGTSPLGPEVRVLSQRACPRSASRELFGLWVSAEADDRGMIALTQTICKP